MKKSEIATIVLQEAEIKRLRYRNKILEKSNRSVFQENIKLRTRLAILEVKHGLSGVCV